MREFEYVAQPARVLFGIGTIAQAGDELDKLGIKRALVLTTSEQVSDGKALVDRLDGRAAGIFSEAAMHTPVSVTGRALTAFELASADGIVSIGGGSTIGLGKAIALRNDAPQLVIPTTYAGSEMTAIVGQSENGRKTTLTSPRVLPETVIYDVELTRDLPLAMTVTSGMNAIAHAIEAMYSQKANPVLSMIAETGIKSLVGALSKLTGGGPRAADARSDALYGAWLCAICLGLGGVALHHKLCHVLGGTFALPHAETHTVVLPHALAYNSPAVPDVVERLKRAIGHDMPAAALFDIASNAGVPVSLQALDMPLDGIDEAVRISLENPYPNPRTIEAEPLRTLLENAWHGQRPRC